MTWAMTHTGFVHLCKPSQTDERVSACGRVMTTFPDTVETWMLKCSKCELVEKRMKS
jgi:hypothetical protein